jgi:restriction system protein
MLPLIKLVSDGNEYRISEVTQSLADEFKLTDDERNERLSLAQDLLERVKACSPRFFENLVLDILVAMGYGGSWDDAA